MDGTTTNALRPHFGRFVGLAVLLGLGVAAPCVVTAAPNAGASVVGAATHVVSNIAAARAIGRVSSGAGRAGVGNTTLRSHHGGAARHGGTAARSHRGGATRHGGTAVRGPRGGAAVRGSAAVVRPVRPWVRRPYYGTIVGGVALGTIIAATAVGVVPTAPAGDLCWFWTGSGKTRGYWDYCSAF
jgi:hypothetical protein